MSSDEQIKQLFVSMWDDFQTGESLPDERLLLAHYTSIPTLEGIMANDELWFSNPLFMNDLDELRFGMNESAREIRQSQEIEKSCGSDERYKLFLEYFDQVFTEFSEEQAFDVYVLCLSRHGEKQDDGLLSMWRGYGGNGNGAAIIFDAQKLNVNENSPFIASKVEYMSTSERLKWIEKKCKDFSAILQAADVSNRQLKIAVDALFELMKLHSIFTKHNGFSEECEWRVVYMRKPDQHPQLDEMLHYAIGRNGVEPKLKLKIKPIDGITTNDFSLDKIVHKIILGPTVSSPLAILAVKRMLEKLNKVEIARTLTASSTPFRG